MITDANLIQPFVIYLRQFVYLSDEEIKQVIMSDATIKEFAKKTFLIKAGDIENNIYFTLSGIARQYYVLNGCETTNLIVKEGQFINSYSSFFTKTPSEYYIQAIEATTVVAISRDHFEAIMKKSHKLERMGRLIITNSLMLKDKRQLSLIRFTPRERFLNFFENNPEIIQRVPQKYIASYLNIKPETFSRFKHLVRKKRISDM